MLCAASIFGGSDMANGNLVTMSNENIKQVEDSLEKMKKVLDNKDALLTTGVFTRQQIDEIQVTYDSTKKLYDIYKPKPIGK
jgi:hypothetical protein